MDKWVRGRNKSRVYMLSDSEFIALFKSCCSYSDVLRNLGLSCNGSASRAILFLRMKELSLTYNDLSSVKTYRKGCARVSDDEIFCENSKHTSNASLKRRFLQKNCAPYRCSICGISDWQGNPICLHLDHVNGNHTDNRLENLRLICPNCDSQQPTYKGKNLGVNSKKRVVGEQNTCLLCSKKISQVSTYCRQCASKIRSVGQRHFSIDRDELKRLIRTTSFTTIAKQYGVTDNAIRKRCKLFGLPYKSSDIKKTSDDEWLLL